MPRRLDFVRFRVADLEIDVDWRIAKEICDRCATTDDPHARTAAKRIAAVGASRPAVLDAGELVALAKVIDEWEIEAETLRRLREELPNA
jgi:hypothetical protein